MVQTRFSSVSRPDAKKSRGNSKQSERFRLEELTVFSEKRRSPRNHFTGAYSVVYLEAS